MTRGAAAVTAAAVTAAAAVAYAAGGCTPASVRDGVRALERGGGAAVATTGGPNASMIYAARAGAGVVVVDLGWVGAEDALRGALQRLGATPRDVVAVFLTHAHRDHVAAWRAVAHAPFYVGRGEAARLYGVRPHGGWIPRLADVLLAPRLPRPGEVTARELGRDTAIVLGADTVLAYATPGHTEGSVAYLLRGVLFVGDGASHAWGGGLRAARRGYSDDVALAAASLARLRRATAGHAPRLACTAHARCAPAGRWPLDR